MQSQLRRWVDCIHVSCLNRDYRSTLPFAQEFSEKDIKYKLNTEVGVKKGFNG